MDPGCHVSPVRHASHPAAAARHHSNVTWVWLVSRLSPEPQVSWTGPDPGSPARHDVNLYRPYAALCGSPSHRAGTPLPAGPVKDPWYALRFCVGNGGVPESNLIFTHGDH